MVLIPIDMPSDCWDCPCHDGEFLSCQLLKDEKRDWEIEQDLDKNRRENCPLVEVLTQEATGTEDTIEEFCKLFIRGDWSTWDKEG